MNLDDLRLFLCHTAADKNIVKKLANHLWELEIVPWFDEWELDPGDSLHDRIGEALESSSFVAVVLSPRSVESRWVNKELRQALSREDREGSSIVIPLLFESVKIPPFLEDRMYVNFEEHYFSALVRLAGFVHRLPKRLISNSLDRTTPEDIEAVKNILEFAGWRSQVIVDGGLYRQIKMHYRVLGKDVSPEIFRIFVEGADDDDDRLPPIAVA